MKKHYLYYLLALFFIQNQVHSQAFFCGASTQHQYLMENDSLYKKGYEISQSQLDFFLNNDANFDKNSNIIYRIPVVVHVIHLGEAVGTGTNISNAQIMEALDELNYDWSHSVGTGINLEVQFCLASVDPNGNPTTGINRVNGSSVTNYATGGIKLGSCVISANESAIKNLSKWPNADYYNIWVVSEICNGNGGVSGYANYPSIGNANDGTVIIYNAMNNQYFTLSHEIGHAFNLLHTFEGDNNDTSCPVNTNCNNDGDKVCDTPPHKRSSCGTTNACSSTGIWTNSSKNTMSYCAGPNRFTQGQKDRVHASLAVAPRLSLLSSVGCGVLNISQNQKVNFKIYPNPTKESFVINHNAIFSDGYFQIYNLYGAKLWEEKLVSNNQIVSTANLATGIYFVNINLDNSQHIVKLVIE